MVFVNVFQLHRDPAVFPDPEMFNPDRFLKNDIPKSAYLPFGGGPRYCLGAQFASMEAKIVLTSVAQKFDLDFPPEPINPQSKGVLTPDRVVSATVVERGRLAHNREPALTN